MSETRGPFAGSCQCGAIRYELEGQIYRLNICHCEDCQKQSGSAFGMSLVIPNETFRLTSGELKTFELTAESGRTKTCAFCADCGIRIYNRTSALMSVKPGTLDDRSWLVPDGHYYTRSQQGWFALPDGVPCYITHEHDSE